MKCPLTICKPTEMFNGAFHLPAGKAGLTDEK
jgi:hypothetical protein